MTAPLVRFAEGVDVTTVGSDARVGLPQARALALRGEGDRLRTLGVLLRTPRPVDAVIQVLEWAPGAPPAAPLIDRLLAAGVLVTDDLGLRLAEIHEVTTTPAGPADGDPRDETSRLLRDYAGADAVPLPAPAPLPGSLEEALAGRRSSHDLTGGSIGLPALAALLALGAGTGRTAEAGLPRVPGGPPGQRTYPSGGGLYPVETLVHPLRVDGLRPAFLRYQALSHRLVPCAPARPPSDLAWLLNEHPVEPAAAVLLLGADLARPSMAKYGAKAYRLMLLEAGHVAQNLLLVAALMGLATLPLCGFRDRELAAAAGLAPPFEVVLYALAVGGPR